MIEWLLISAFYFSMVIAIGVQTAPPTATTRELLRGVALFAIPWAVLSAMFLALSFVCEQTKLSL